MPLQSLRCSPEQVDVLVRVLRGEIRATGPTRRGAEGKTVREFTPGLAHEIEETTRGVVSDWKTMRDTLERALDALVNPQRARDLREATIREIEALLR